MNARLRVTMFAALATALGSLTLLPIFDSYGWLPRVALVILAVTAAAVVMQRIRPLAPAAPLVMFAVWAAVVTALYAHAVAPLGFVPGPAALRLLHTTLSSGFTDTTQLAAPVPITRGLSLMTTGGIGLVAVVVETLAGTLRRPAVAGLPLLAIFTVPAATISDGVGWQPFVFAAAGYLALLLAEGRDRVSRWGRPVRASRGPVAGSSAAAAARPALAASQSVGRRGMTNHLTQVGRRVGFTAISIAVIVPVIVPGLHSGWFGTYRTAGTGGLSDDGSATSISPIVTVHQDLQQPEPTSLFSYTTTGTPDYLRLITLDTFDGTQWTVSSIATPQDTKIDKGIPKPAGVTLQPVGTTRTNVTVTNLRQSYLPAAAAPTTVKAHGDWRYNPVNPAIYGNRSSTIHLSYSVTNSVYAPSATFLNSVPNDASLPTLRSYLATPTNLPLIIGATADAIVNRAGALTSYQKAVALQAWFQQGTYDISIKTGSNENALVTFVHDRRGYCEQFAATMALMARLEGIPARVVVGFTPGTKSGDNYVVTTADAHAWPELYFDDAGWLRFEPTPRADGQTSNPNYANTSTTPVPVTADSTGPSASASAATSTRDVIPRAVGAPTSGKHTPKSTRLPVGGIVAGAVLLLVLACAPIARWLTRRRRWTAADTAAARAHAAWAELGDDLRDLGVPWTGEHDSPRRAAATLVATRRLGYDAVAQAALVRLTRAEEMARYAARPTTAGPTDVDPRADEVVVRKALFESASAGRRVRARLAPSSTSRVAATGSNWVVDRSRAVSDALTGAARRLSRRSGQDRD